MEARLRSLAIPGWAPRERLISYVGHGESFDAWKLADADSLLPALLARVSRRQDRPRPVEQEIAALRALAGTGLAPALYLYETAAAGSPGGTLIVTSFEPGTVKAPGAWSFGEVRAVIDRAAHLHIATARPGTSSGVAWFEGSIGYWRGTAPETVAAMPTAALVEAVEAFVQERESAFESLTEVALVHGDLVASNVLLDAGRPRFVDWEWAEIDDVARDLALIGGQSYGGEWYVPLGDAQVAELIAQYARTRGLAPAESAALAVRRDVWMALDRLFSSIHFALNGPPEQRAAALVMQQTLAAWLRVSIA